MSDYKSIVFVGDTHMSNLKTCKWKNIALFSLCCATGATAAFLIVVSILESGT